MGACGSRTAGGAGKELVLRQGQLKGKVNYHRDCHTAFAASSPSAGLRFRLWLWLWLGWIWFGRPWIIGWLAGSASTSRIFAWHFQSPYESDEAQHITTACSGKTRKQGRFRGHLDRARGVSSNRMKNTAIIGGQRFFQISGLAP